MFDSESTTSPSALDQETLRSLEKQTAPEIVRERGSVRIEHKLKVVVRSGNSSALLAFKIQGLTADLSRGGCRLLLPLPLGVGDIYRLDFDDSAHKLPQLFARCVRCRLLREDAFEAGMQFFTPVDLPASLQPQGKDLLD